jgi:hypothetical protein
MTAARPVRDSALDALGFASRVLIRPSYWWAPTLLLMLAVIPVLVLPVLTIPGYMDLMNGRTPLRTPAELNAFFASFFRAYIPIVILSIVLSLAITPFASALAYRLAARFVDGQPPRPFPIGILNLAWRFLLQALALFGLVLGFVLVCLVVFAILQGVAGLGLAVFVTLIAAIVGAVVLVTRVSIAPALLLSGAGPVESITMAWQMTRGHGLMVFRWFIVIGVIVAVAASVIGGLLQVLAGAVGQPLLGSIVSSVAAGPTSVIYAIILIRLSRLLSGPIPPPAPPDLPAWMNDPGAQPEESR